MMKAIDLKRASNIRGWMGLNELEWLAKAAQESKVIVEFGSYLGRSTRALADNTDGIVYAFDPWTHYYHDNDGNLINILDRNAYAQFLDNLADHIDTGKVAHFKTYSCDCWIRNADLVFIDGDHRYEHVMEDILLAQKMVNKGIIAGHDYDQSDWPGVKKAVDEVFGNGIERVDSIWYRRF